MLIKQAKEWWDGRRTGKLDWGSLLRAGVAVGDVCGKDGLQSRLAGRDGHVRSGKVATVVVAGYSRRLRGRGRLPRWAHDDGRAEAQRKTRAGEAVAVRKEGGKPHGQCK